MLIFAQYVTYNQKSHLIYVTMPDLESPLEKSGYGPGLQQTAALPHTRKF